MLKFTKLSNEAFEREGEVNRELCVLITNISYKIMFL